MLPPDDTDPVTGVVFVPGCGRGPDPDGDQGRQGQTVGRTDHNPAVPGDRHVAACWGGTGL
jgi:hypothetical protein